MTEISLHRPPTADPRRYAVSISHLDKGAVRAGAFDLAPGVVQSRAGHEATFGQCRRQLMKRYLGIPLDLARTKGRCSPSIR